MKKSVFVVGDNVAVDAMFKDNGFNVVDKIKNADFIQFYGGADIDPQLYGQRCLEKNRLNRNRDYKEAIIARLAFKDKIPMAGICRGGQLLNVLCGGSLWQDADNHYGSHIVYNLENKKVFTVSSSHHQLMIPNEQFSKTLLIANRASKRLKYNRTGSRIVIYTKQDYISKGEDVEAVIYPTVNIFCVQGHPEYTGYGQLTEYYLDNLSRILKK